MLRNHRKPFLIFALLTSALSACAPKAPTQAAASSPIAAELTADPQHLAAAPQVPGLALVRPVAPTACAVRVTQPVTATLTLPGLSCSDAVLELDPRGGRLAVGQRGGRLTVHYLGQRGHVLTRTETVAEPLDWAQVPPLRAALPLLWAEALQRDVDEPQPQLDTGLLDEWLAMPQGDAMLADALIGRQTSPWRPAHEEGDELWLRARQRLPAAQRARVDAALAHAVTQPRPGPDVVVRWLATADLADPHHDNVLLARLTELAGASGSPSQAEQHALAALLERLQPRHLEATSALACQVMTRWQHVPSPHLAAVPRAPDVQAASRVLARGGARCPAVAAVIDALGSQPGATLCTEAAWFCPASGQLQDKRQRCTREELLRSAGALPTLDWPQVAARLHQVVAPSLQGLVLAYAREPVPLPVALDRQLQRQNYTWDTLNAPPCGKAQLGQRCAPDWAAIAPSLACFDGAATEVQPGGRAGILHIDDARRVRWLTGSGPTIKGK